MALSSRETKDLTNRAGDSIRLDWCTKEKKAKGKQGKNDDFDSRAGIRPFLIPPSMFSNRQEEEIENGGVVLVVDTSVLVDARHARQFEFVCWVQTPGRPKEQRAPAWLFCLEEENETLHFAIREERASPCRIH